MHAFQDLAVKPRKVLALRAGQGRTLVELLVSLLIGFVILGAVLLTSVGTQRSNSVNQQMARLQEDAAIATHLLTMQLRLAGYSAVVVKPVNVAPVNIGAPAATNHNYNGPPVRGCENGFGNVGAPDFTTLNCAGGAAGTAPDAISIIYEGDASNTMPTAGNPNNPVDCLGTSVANNIPSDGGGLNPYQRVENRYYIAADPNTGNPALYCIGSGNFNGAPQPLIDNVVAMEISYGVAGTPVTNPGLGAYAQSNEPFFEPVRFMRADQVDALPAFPAGTPAPFGTWSQVVSASVCLLLRSDLGAIDPSDPANPYTYTNCNGTVVTPAANDTRAYRAVRITVGFKNHTPPCNDNTGAALTRPDHCNILTP
jgi:type IV pilus assembly protein PilW